MSTISNKMPQTRQMLFISGRISLDLAHTGGIRTEQAKAFEQLHEPNDFADWLARSQLSLTGLTISKNDLAAVYELREAIWCAAHAVQRQVVVAALDRDIINKYAAHSPIIPCIGHHNRLLWTRPISTTAVLSYIARDTIDLLGSEAREKIRECANPACPLLFVDSSRSGKRRWCSMERCGSMAKTTKFRNKTKRSLPTNQG